MGTRLNHLGEAVLTSTRNLCSEQNKKNNVFPCKPQFYYIKVGFKGAKLYRHVFVIFYTILVVLWRAFVSEASLTNIFERIVFINGLLFYTRQQKKVREKSRECHNHKPQPFPDPKRKRKPTNPNKHKSNKRTKSTKISSLFPKRGNRNTKRTEKHKNKMTHGKTYNKSPRRINHKATKSKTNTGTTALERSVE